ncbi:MAG: DUF45 domain-containing protein, partial [Phaeodactylibacter sp.]|nr:DUF45 domain-containing protein [Phaeodactylibacter sp.]
MTKETVQFGSKEIAFRLKYQARKSLGITVHPDCSVTVKAPLDAPLGKIKEKIRKRAPWILKQQRFFLAFEPRTPARQYISGETHLYLGRQYRLKVVDSTEAQVKLLRGFLEVYTPDRAEVRSLLRAWYEAHAEVKFRQYAAPWIERFKRYNVEPDTLVIQWMEKRWGSCTP